MSAAVRLRKLKPEWHGLADSGHESVATALLQGRADVDAASLAGDTPLMWAAHQGMDHRVRLEVHLCLWRKGSSQC